MFVMLIVKIIAIIVVLNGYVFNSGTNAEDICDIVPNGVIDTAFRWMKWEDETESIGHSQNDLKDYFYILKGEHYWQLSNDLLKLISKEPQILRQKKEWKKDNYQLKDIDMAFTIFSEGTIFNSWTTYFIKGNQYYMFEETSADVSHQKSGPFKIANISLAFHSRSFSSDESLIIFVNQVLNNEKIERKAYVYDFEDPENPELNQKQIPEFVVNVDEKYWITAIVENTKNAGIVFVKYNNEGYHCYFNESNNNCSKRNLIRNEKLFGCDDRPVLAFSSKSTNPSSTAPKERLLSLSVMFMSCFIGIITFINKV